MNLNGPSWLTFALGLLIILAILYLLGIRLDVH